jgi:hypothetical protein
MKASKDKFEKTSKFRASAAENVKERPLNNPTGHTL